MTLPVLSRREMRNWESQSWTSGRSERLVIGNVGRRLADWLQGHSRPGDSLLLLAGRGHNGDDVRAAVPFICDRQPRLLSVSDPMGMLPLLREAIVTRPAWILDGLFGIGLNRPLSQEWQDFLREINESRIRVAAVDVPSGLDADSGVIMGAALRADVTLTVGAVKRGLVQGPDSHLAGRVEVLEALGLTFPPSEAEGELDWIRGLDFFDFPPRHKASSHKGSKGHLFIVAGSLGYHGAAVLAAKGAQSVGPGLVTLLTSSETLISVASSLTAAMVKPWTAAADGIKGADALLVGPGLAASGLESMRERVSTWWKELRIPMIVDASALDWVPRGKVGSDGIRVITPHPGEAARMLGTTVGHIQSDRPGALRRLSREFGNCWVVLKGQGTLLGRAEGRVWINSSGGPELGQGGTGDVLAGMLGGLLTAHSVREDIKKLLGFGVWSHGVRGDRLSFSQPGWTAELLATSGIDRID